MTQISFHAPQTVQCQNQHKSTYYSKHTHTHTFNGPLSRTTWVSRYQKGKTNLDFTEAKDSEWQWHQLGHMQVCTSLQIDNHTSTPPLRFLQAYYTNNVKSKILGVFQINKTPWVWCWQIKLFPFTAWTDAQKNTTENHATAIGSNQSGQQTNEYRMWKCYVYWNVLTTTVALFPTRNIKHQIKMAHVQGATAQSIVLAGTPLKTGIFCWNSFTVSMPFLTATSTLILGGRRQSSP